MSKLTFLEIIALCLWFIGIIIGFTGMLGISETVVNFVQGIAFAIVAGFYSGQLIGKMFID